MTKTPSWLRTAHRIHVGVTVIVFVTLLSLNLSGVFNTGTALRLLLLLELPLLVVFLVITIVRFRHAARDSAPEHQGVLARLEAEEPLLRPAVMELRAFHSLLLAIRKKRKTPDGAIPFGYTKSSMTLPVMVLVLSVVELLAVHLLIPWQWLRIVLLVLTLWGLLFIGGFFALRVVHPHFITSNHLQLRWAHKTVLSTPLMNVSSAARSRKRSDTQPRAQQDQLVLTQFQTPNIVLRFTEPVAAEAPVSKKELPVNFQASEVHLYVDDPDKFIQTLAAHRQGVKP